MANPKESSQDEDKLLPNASRDASEDTSVPPKNRRNKSAQKMEVETVTPQPRKSRQTLFDEARRLATLPRHRLNKMVSTAFWAAIAASPSAISGYSDLFSKTPTQTKILDLIEILILVVCLTAFVIGLITTERGIQTSEEYLLELYPKDLEIKPKGWRKIVLIWLKKWLS